MSRCLISTKHQKVIFNRTKSPSPDKISDKDPSPPIFGTGYEQSQYQRHPLESDLKGTQRNSQLRSEEEEGGDKRKMGLTEKDQEAQEANEELNAYF